MQDVIENWAAENSAVITKQQFVRLARHQAMVLETNKYMNLTAITDPAEFTIKHIIDSLTLLPHIPHGVTLGDIGTGAGFPGLVLAIMREDIHVTLVDSLRKRVLFLQKVIDDLGLVNVTAVHSRAEDLSENFDICTARAVARMDKLARWVLPLTKQGGTFLAMKGPAVIEELESAKAVLRKLGGCVKDIHIVKIADGLFHSIVVVTKIL